MSKSGAKIYLIKEIELIDDCNWADWLCEVELSDGTIISDCNIQSDGYLMALETLTDNCGKLIV